MKCSDQISPYTDGFLLETGRSMADSGRVGLQRVPGKAMAVDEHLIDQVNGFPARAGWRARPER